MTAHQPIPVDRLRRALAAWGLEDAERVEPIPPGATADVFLVRHGDARWVAKFGYQETAHFDAGLAATEVLDLPGWDLATPVRTLDGERYRTAEWPDGYDRPLALLRWIEGRPLDADDPTTPECKATVCARVHAQLLTVDPATVGVEVPRADEPAEPLEPWDLGPNQWLDDVFVALQHETIEWRSRVRPCVAVWDGPDVLIRERDGRIGLIDFGHVTWQPLVNVVANRSLIGADQGVASLPRFLDVLQRDLPLTREEHAALDAFRRYNAGIYARWAANRVHEHGDRSVKSWLDSLVAFLRSDRSGRSA